MPTNKKRLRARVNVGRGADGKTVYKWASGYTPEELEENKNQILSEFAAPAAADSAANRPTSAVLPAMAPGTAAAPGFLATLQAALASMAQGAGGQAVAQLLAPLLPALAPGLTPALAAPRSFGDYALEWYRLYKAPEVRDSTADMYDNVLQVHLLPAFGAMNLPDITATMLQEFMAKYKGRSKSIIDKVALTIKQLFASALEAGLILVDPAARLHKPRGTEGERKPIPYKQLPDVLDALVKHKDGALPLLMIFTGLRRGEALGLQWGDVEGATITIRRQAVIRKNQAVVGEPKTPAAFRTIPLPDIVAQQLGRPGRPGDFVFGGAKPYSYSKVKRMFERLARDIPQLEGVTPHCLRHTYVLLLRRARVDAATAQYLLGHEDYETTANVYTHIDGEDLTDATAQIDTIARVVAPSGSAALPGPAVSGGNTSPALPVATGAAPATHPTTA